MTALRPAAFDAVAEEYDRAFTNTRLGRWLREGVRERLAAHYSPGMRVLEIGCGTGEDAIWLAQRGVHVTATDVSAAMLDVARRKAEIAGVGDQLTFRRFDLGTYELDVMGFDGAFSNFGPLNCVDDLPSAARVLADAVSPGGRVVLVVMGPWCVWEMAWYLAHGQARLAFRRWHAGGVTARIRSDQLRVFYHAPAQLREACAPWFHPSGMRGIGVFLPPSSLAPWVERHPRAAGLLRVVEAHLAGQWPFRLLGDHYLIELERRG
jgi:SAM-dependent methyltransferase